MRLRIYEVIILYMKQTGKNKRKPISATSILGIMQLVLFVVMAFIIANKVFVSVTTSVTESIQAKAENQALTIEKSFAGIIDTTKDLSSSASTIFRASRNEHKYLLNTLLYNAVATGNYESVWIVTEPGVFGKKQGFCYVMDPETGKPVEDVVLGFDSDWYFSGINSEKAMIDEDIDLDTIDGEQFLMTSAYSRILNSRGKVIGLAGIDVTLNNLNQMLSGEAIYKGSKISLLNSKGKILATDGDQNLDEVFYLYEKNPEYFNITKADGAVSFQNGENITTIVPLEYDECGNVWHIVVDTPVKNAIVPAKKLMIFIVVCFLIYLALLTAGNIKIILSTMKTHKTEQQIGVKLAEEIQNLVVSAKETSATSQDQSAAVKEIVATMEDTNELSKNISAKIEDVSAVAGKTTDDVDDSSGSLNLNMAKLEEISAANSDTIEGIKKLSTEIDGIWDIVTMITSVADQAKIIAFNAELEAASAGEAGKNFHIVASEIRRLADGIIDSTKEIKGRISGIQNSSDALILASESGTVKVEEGIAAAKELEERFASIKNAAEITEASAKDISVIIQQQSAASSQILVAIKQISAGVENFSMATESISSTSENLKTIADELTSSQKKNIMTETENDKAGE